MDSQPAIHDTFVLERTYPQPPARVFAALADPALKRRWFADGEQHDVELYEMDFRVGGRERLRYRMKPGTPFPGALLASEGFILDIVPERRVVSAASMQLGEQRISVSQVTLECVPEGSGTRLTCTHQGVFFEGADGPRIRAMGWRSLLERIERALER